MAGNLCTGDDSYNSPDPIFYQYVNYDRYDILVDTCANDAISTRTSRWTKYTIFKAKANKKKQFRDSPTPYDPCC